MEPSFWKERWIRNEIGFHLSRVHPLLQKFLPVLDLPETATVFLPLCGKTLDIGYLLDQGYSVVGAELCEIAVQALFEQLNLTPEKTFWVGGGCYRANRLTVFQGDFFELTRAQFATHSASTVDAVYDRAALVALPEEMRVRYANHLTELVSGAPQLLIAFDYDQAEMSGPPFSVPETEVRNLYVGRYDITELSRRDIIESEPRFRERGLSRFVEMAWHLS